MNKNKIILAIIAGILVFAVLAFGVLLNSSNPGQQDESGNAPFTVWIYGDDQENFLEFVTKFKEVYPKHKNNNFIVESFSDYEEYYYALSSAFSSGRGPDIFTLNNSEKESIFENQILALNPNVFSPNDFRKRYVGVFGDDLIQQVVNGEEIQEFLRGIPVGYETLGLFYNRRYVKSSDLTSFSILNNTIASLAEKRPNLIPLGLGNGSTVSGVADIMTQFFLLEDGVVDLSSLTGPKIKESLSLYFLYGDESGDNKYNAQFESMQATGRSNVDLFSRSQIAIIPGYPRLLDKIAEAGFSKSFLLASPFPEYFQGAGKIGLNYNYFVLNKDSQNTGIAYDLFAYLSSDNGASQYLDEHSHYLPALLSLESDLLEEKVDDDYNVVLGDFHHSDSDLVSFDVGVKNIFDDEIVTLLDTPNNYINDFEVLRQKLICISGKVTRLERLSQSCQ
ncbi:ABC transporter substrate-binding protein [Candidatus Gracilibacteria bacterium]|nr:ABC transporter substrate-binding protein [Candidatus Gracilibacteria bacterium]